MGVGRVAWCPQGPVWALRREGLQAGAGGTVYGGVETVHRDSSRGAMGPKCSCRSRGEAAPVPSHDPFRFQGHGVSWGSWAVPVAVEGADSRGPGELPTSRGLVQGIPSRDQGKRPGQSYSTWTCLSFHATGAPATLGDFTESRSARFCRKRGTSQ